MELGLKLTDKEAGPENQVIYNKGREQYIMAYNAAPTGRVTAADLGLIEKKKQKPVAKELVHITHGNRMSLGGILDDELGTPIGTIKMTQFHRVKVACITVMANSQSEELGAPKVSDVHKQCMAKNAVKVTPKELKEGEAGDHLYNLAPLQSRKAAAADDGDDDSEVDMTKENREERVSAEGKEAKDEGEKEELA